MINALIPQDEDKRLNAVKDLETLDTLIEERFDIITRPATKFFNGAENFRQQKSTPTLSFRRTISSGDILTRNASKTG